MRLPLAHLDLRLPLLCAFLLLTAQLLLALDREALLSAFPVLSAQLLTALVGDTFLFVSLAI